MAAKQTDATCEQRELGASLMANPDYVDASVIQPSVWIYSIDPATGASQATYNGEVNGGAGSPFATQAYVATQIAPVASNASTALATANTALTTANAAAAASAGNTGRNVLLNGAMHINQRVFAGGALTTGTYGHDAWKAGAAGCTYTAAGSGGAPTVLTITAGSLQQIVDAPDVVGGVYTVSWAGTAQGRVNGGTYAASPFTTASLPTNTAITVEFNTGTLSAVQCELGASATAFEHLDVGTDLRKCQRRACKSLPQSVAPANNGGYPGVIVVSQNQSGAALTIAISARFPVVMRAAPTVTFYNPTGTGTPGTFDNGAGSASFTPTAGSIADDATIVSVAAINVGQPAYGHFFATADL